MGEDHFGPQVARSYDQAVAEMFDKAAVEPAVEVLSELAGDGRALEFAIGTGRIALPLAARGIDVCGIDLSEAMVEQLRQKLGGPDLPVTIGDMASVRVEGRFRLVYLVFNTIGNLTTRTSRLPASVTQPSIWSRAAASSSKSASRSCAGCRPGRPCCRGE